MNSKQQYVQVEVQGHASSGSAQPVHQPVQQHQPAQQQQAVHQPAQQQQPVHQPVHQQQPAQTQSGSTTHFVVHGRAGGADKLKFAHSQEESAYHFTPTSAPSADTSVEVAFTTTPPALQFKLSTTTYKLTQTFNMPFPIDQSLISREGETVILRFPDY